jgi:hypothetical protein
MSYGTNINSPQGFQPSQYQNGALWNGQTTDYPIVSGYATSLFRGDPITWDTNGTIKIGVAGSGIIGIFWGVVYTDTFGIVQFQDYWNANTVTTGALNAIARVIDDANVLYDIAVSNVNNQPGPINAVTVLQTDLGRNINFAIASAANSFNALPAGSVGAGTTPAANPQGGNTTSGNSGYFLDYNTIGNTATLNCKIMRFTPVPGNGPGGATGPFFQNVLAKINNDVYNGGTGTAGAH